MAIVLYEWLPLVIVATLGFRYTRIELLKNRIDF